MRLLHARFSVVERSSKKDQVNAAARTRAAIKHLERQDDPEVINGLRDRSLTSAKRFGKDSGFYKGIRADIQEKG